MGLNKVSYDETSQEVFPLFPKYTNAIKIVYGHLKRSKIFDLTHLLIISRHKT